VENISEGNNCTQESWNINTIIEWLSWHSTVNAGSFTGKLSWQLHPLGCAVVEARFLDDGRIYVQVWDLFPCSNG